MIVGKQNNQKKSYLLASIWRNNQIRRGFSLIEVLITLLVLTLSITGVVLLMTKNIADVQNSKNQIIAAMLAQEGIELVRNLKDNKTLALADCDNCRISMDSSTNESTNIKSDSNNKLFLHDNFYQHGGSGTPTKFYRRVDVKTTEKDGTDETIVDVYVTWNNKGFVIELNDPKNNCTTANKCVSVTSNIVELVQD